MTVALVGVTSNGGSVVAQQETLTPNEGVALVRQVNQILGRLYVRNNAQMMLKDVVADDTFTRAQGFELTNDQSGLYKRYRLTITHIAGDKESYQLSLVPANGCGPSWFSNETGLIFAGNCLQ
jgi:hypothetical protein